MLGRGRLNEALTMLGALLAERDQRIGVLVIGGSSLLLLGVIERPTADVDIIGFPTAVGYVAADGLPEFPPGLGGRVSVRAYGGLEVHLPAIEDLVCFKLYAAVDQGERSKHFADLLALSPTPEQLRLAARWARTHDPSPGFRGELRRILTALGVEVPDGES